MDVFHNAIYNGGRFPDKPPRIATPAQMAKLGKQVFGFRHMPGLLWSSAEAGGCLFVAFQTYGFASRLLLEPQSEAEDTRSRWNDLQRHGWRLVQAGALYTHLHLKTKIYIPGYTFLDSDIFPRTNYTATNPGLPAWGQHCRAIVQVGGFLFALVVMKYSGKLIAMGIERVMEMKSGSVYGSFGNLKTFCTNVKMAFQAWYERRTAESMRKSTRKFLKRVLKDAPPQGSGQAYSRIEEKYAESVLESLDASMQAMRAARSSVQEHTVVSNTSPGRFETSVQQPLVQEQKQRGFPLKLMLSRGKAAQQGEGNQQAEQNTASAAPRSHQIFMRAEQRPTEQSSLVRGPMDPQPSPVQGPPYRQRVAPQTSVNARGKQPIMPQDYSFGPCEPRLTREQPPSYAQPKSQNTPLMMFDSGPLSVDKADQVNGMSRDQEAELHGFKAAQELPKAETCCAPSPPQNGPISATGGQPQAKNNALQDYQMQLKLLKIENLKRLRMAGQVQDSMGEPGPCHYARSLDLDTEDSDGKDEFSKTESTERAARLNDPEYWPSSSDEEEQQ